MLWQKLLVVSALLLIGSPTLAQDDEDDLSPQDRQAICEKLAPSLVRVEYYLKYDKGEAPRSHSSRRSYRTYHESFDAETLIKEERPLEVPGFVAGESRIVTRDVMIHPRFVKEIRVSLDGQSVGAEIDRYFVDTASVSLSLNEPLPGAAAPAFNKDAKEPYYAVLHDRHDAVWTTTFGSFPTRIAVTDSNTAYMQTTSEMLVVDKTGAPIGLVMTTQLPLDDAWKGSPLDRPAVSAAEMKSMLDAAEKADEQRLLRVSLRFRSPKKKAGGTSWQFRPSMEETGTEQNVVGVLLSEGRILVIVDMKPNKTALLNKILVYPQDGEAIEATFKCSLKDYGCFIAELQKPLPGEAELDTEDCLALREKLLMAAQVEMQGEKRVTYHQHLRIASYTMRWKRLVFPQVVGSWGDAILFDTSGRLVAIPVARREKVSEQERWGRNSEILLPSALLSAMIAALDENTDPNNIPLSEEEENRLAWMGVVLQGLNTELARINDVSDLTKDGATGALVSYVYPGSPAAEAGVEPGWILLRLHVEGEPKPYEVEYEDSMGFFGGAFPWEQLDDLPEEYMDDIPTPWPAAENSFTRALSDMGFGKSYTAEFFHDGKVEKKDFVITQSPPHYDSAPKYKSDAIGLTVRDLTFEVRRYFQKTEDEPGVVISKVEPGSKVAVAGIKPYEIITAVNDTPVHNVKDFEKSLAGKTELRFAVKRMTRGRIVKVRLDAPAEKKAEATEPARSTTDTPTAAGEEAEAAEPVKYPRTEDE